MPTIVALRQHCEHIRRAELERLDYKLAACPGGRSTRPRGRDHAPHHGEAAAAPTEQLKSLGDADTVGAYSEALTRLFRLGDEAEAERGDGNRSTGRAVHAPETPRAPVMLRIGTRGSQLALWQANTVAARIAASGGPPCTIVAIKTSGDRLQEAPLSEIGGKRLFVKEIEDALLGGEIDLAVHSSKDMSVRPARWLAHRRRVAARKSPRCRRVPGRV